MEKFRRAVITELQRRHQVTASPAADGQSLQIGARRVPVDVHFLAYEAASFFGRGAVVRAAAAAVVDVLAGDDVLTSYDAARPLLRVRITSEAAIDLQRLRWYAVDGESRTRPLHRALVGDLFVQPFLDRANDRVMLPRALLDAWGVDVDEVFGVATDAVLARPLSFRSTLGMHTHETDDAMGATALLALGPMLDRAGQDLPRDADEARTSWRDHFSFDPARAVVMVPHPDVVAVLDRDDPKAWVAAAAYVAQRASQGEALSALALRRERGRWLEVAPPPSETESLTTRFLAEARVMIRAAQYETQRPVLTAVFPDLFAAEVMQVEAPDGSEYTLSTYTRGAPAILPITDRVALVELGRPNDVRIVAWDELATLRGITLEPFACTPPRAEISGWPVE